MTITVTHKEFTIALDFGVGQQTTYADLRYHLETVLQAVVNKVVAPSATTPAQQLVQSIESGELLRQAAERSGGLLSTDQILASFNGRDASAGTIQS